MAFLAWLPFLWVPLASDAAGFLMLSRQWSPGSSLYGDYWVDRPPLLLWLFRLAGLGPVTLHSDGLLAPGVVVLGALASAATVLLAGLLAAPGRAAEGRTGPGTSRPCSRPALLASPLLGMPETNGEVARRWPFVLGRRARPGHSTDRTGGVGGPCWWPVARAWPPPVPR